MKSGVKAGKKAGIKIGTIAVSALLWASHGLASVPPEDAKIEKTLRAIRYLEKKMRLRTQRQSELDREIQATENSVTDVSEKMNTLQKNIGEQKALLAKRLRALHQLSGQTFAGLISQTKSASSLSRNLKVLFTITERDLSLVRGFSENRDALKIQLEHLNARKNKLQSLQKSLELEEESLVSEESKKKILLSALKKMKDQDHLEDLASKSGFLGDQLSELENLLKSPSLSNEKGHLLWPLLGLIADPLALAGSLTNHQSFQGKFILGQTNSRVKSVFSGKVKYVGSALGFGNTMVIDHGDHFSTVYSGLSKMTKQIGDMVKMGEEIGSLDVHPFFQEPTLYFEIRHYSRALNPIKWLAKEQQ